MEQLVERCAGLDVHQAEITACARVPSEQGIQEIVEEFGTTVPDLLTMLDWLTASASLISNRARRSPAVPWLRSPGSPPRS